MQALILKVIRYSVRQFRFYHTRLPYSCIYKWVQNILCLVFTVITAYDSSLLTIYRIRWTRRGFLQHNKTSWSCSGHSTTSSWLQSSQQRNCTSGRSQIFLVKRRMPFQVSIHIFLVQILLLPRLLRESHWVPVRIKGLLTYIHSHVRYSTCAIIRILARVKFLTT